jgi:hypothetical protein
VPGFKLIKPHGKTVTRFTAAQQLTTQNLTWKSHTGYPKVQQAKNNRLQKLIDESLRSTREACRCMRRGSWSSSPAHRTLASPYAFEVAATAAGLKQF